jgi:hypothetical protein
VRLKLFGIIYLYHVVIIDNATPEILAATKHKIHSYYYYTLIGAMKSAFGLKRKPRKIEVDEDDDGLANASTPAAKAVDDRMSPSCVLMRLTDDGECS